MCVQCVWLVIVVCGCTVVGWGCLFCAVAVCLQLCSGPCVLSCVGVVCECVGVVVIVLVRVLILLRLVVVVCCLVLCVVGVLWLV